MEIQDTQKYAIPSLKKGSTDQVPHANFENAEINISDLTYIICNRGSENDSLDSGSQKSSKTPPNGIFFLISAAKAAKSYQIVCKLPQSINLSENDTEHE